MRKLILSLALAATVLGGALLTPRNAQAQNGNAPMYSNGGYYWPSYGTVFRTNGYSYAPSSYSYGPYNNPMNGTYYNPMSARYPSVYSHSSGYTTTVPTYFYYRPGYGYTYSRGYPR
jgi:hypothetical protein